MPPPMIRRYHDLPEKPAVQVPRTPELCWAWCSASLSPVQGAGGTEGQPMSRARGLPWEAQTTPPAPAHWWRAKFKAQLSTPTHQGA